MACLWFYLHDVHLHSSPVEFVHSLENSWIKKHSKSSLWSLCIFVLIVIHVSQNVNQSFNIVFCTYWTCSPDGQCRWGSHQSQFRSSRQQTSAPPAAGAGCSVACLHWGENSSYLWNFDVQIKRFRFNLPKTQDRFSYSYYNLIWLLLLIFIKIIIVMFAVS